jgi:uncharacterized membrane protein (DUF485 family)
MSGNCGVDLEEFVLFSTAVMARQLAANSLAITVALEVLRFLILFIVAAVFCTIALSW